MKKTDDGVASIDDYIRSRPAEQREALRLIRAAVAEALPEARETISYKMPAFTQKGIVLYFASYERHIGLYPTASGIEAFKAEFANYKSSKGAVQFPLDEPLPLELVVRIAKFRAEENERKYRSKRAT